MFCANCGTKVEDGVAFCPQCGKAVANSAKPVTPSQGVSSQGAPTGAVVKDYGFSKRNPLMVAPTFLTLIIMIVGLFTPVMKFSILGESKSFSWLTMTRMALGIGDEISTGVSEGVFTFLLPILIIILIAAYVIVEKRVSLLLHVVCGAVVIICAIRVMSGIGEVSRYLKTGTCLAGIILLVGGIALVAEGLLTKFMPKKA